MSLLTAQLYSAQLDLILLVIAIVADALLAYVVYRSDSRSATNRIFSLLSFFTILWLINNYLTSHILNQPQFADFSLLLSRFGILWAAPMSSLFFLLAHTIPSDKILLSRRTFYLVIGLTVVMMLLNISPYAFVGVNIMGNSVQPVPGPGLMPFSVISTLFSILAVYWLVKKYRSSEDVAKKQLKLVLIGILAMLGLIIATVLIPILLFNSLIFLAFTPLYTLAFLGLTAYAITKYQLFNIKVLLTQALTFVIWIVLFAKLFGEESRNAQLIDLLVLLFTVIFGFFLVRSVQREVEQRELIEKQEKELELANQQQVSLLHFISHEIKGYLTKGQNAFAGIIEGDYGEVSKEVNTLSQSALQEMRKGVEMVMNILDASNFKKGTVTYEKNVFDFKAAVLSIVDDLRSTAEAKGLAFEIAIAPTGSYRLMGDEDKMKKHVIRNLVDNAIRYTPHGKIKLALSGSLPAATALGFSNAEYREENLGDGKHRIHFAVQDSGVGITPDDMKRLFTEGGHGKDSMKVNVDSTGYGLYIAKQVVEAHDGSIHAESPGEGKGSIFIVDLPAA